MTTLERIQALASDSTGFLITDPLSSTAKR
jgi:hypothetical protein